ncbi:MAG: hypothetical protein FD143_3125 [Ignavibacteria bacterium]|nr:MAG: hypothetical protein FD143_3125 [Ignavibacteria bacterium]KAF0158525.1 MAG: hypothetical protein FD188_2525 [Ignavibacteria bacterium]
MAELEKPMFGNIKGKFGKAVFRQRNGINYIAQRPSSYTVPATEAYQHRTTKFRISSKIAAVINSIPTLKSLWKLCTPENLSAYNYLISVNYNALNNDQTVGRIKIAPDSKVGVRLDSVELTTDKLTVNLHPLTEHSLIDTSLEKKVKLIALLVLSKPVDNNTADFEVLELVSPTKTFELNTALSFDLFISTSDELKIALYQNKSIHSSLFTFTNDDNVVNNSSTFSHTLV